jgi:hypothetical protein
MTFTTLSLLETVQQVIDRKSGDRISVLLPRAHAFREGLARVDIRINDESASIQFIN